MAVGSGLVLWVLSVGRDWTASYDHLFRFGTHALTNQVVVVLMDNEAYANLEQARDRPWDRWDRALHARLLNKLADDGCPQVVFDVFFREPGEPGADQSLGTAMARLTNVVLAAEQTKIGRASCREECSLTCRSRWSPYH